LPALPDGHVAKGLPLPTGKWKLQIRRVISSATVMKIAQAGRRVYNVFIHFGYCGARRAARRVQSAAERSLGSLFKKEKIRICVSKIRNGASGDKESFRR
jgi:hypothetical protein